MPRYYKYDTASVTKRSESDRNEIFFDGWAISKRDGDYFLTYISSEHGGGERKVSISEEDYGEAKAGKKGLLELLEKYI